MHIHILCRYQRKRIKPYISLRGDLIVQLSDRSATEISRIFVFGIDIFDRFIDPLKIGIGDDCLAPQHKPSLIGDLKRDILECPCIISNDLSDDPVSSGDRLLKFPVLIGKDNGQSIHFPGKQCRIGSYKSSECLSLFGLVEREHRRFVCFLWQCIYCLISYINSRTVCQNDACFCFHLLQLIVQSVVFSVAHDLPVFLIIGLCRFVQFFYQFFHLVYGCCFHDVLLSL